MYVIGFVGGPCSGKTKCLPKIKEKLEENGYRVYLLSESATEVSMSGIVPNYEMPMELFQEFVIDTQIQKENLYEKLKKIYNDKTIVLLCDRTVIDSLLYLPLEVFEEKIKKHNLTTEDVFNRYDMIIHMSTVAGKIEGKYKYKGNSKKANQARRESPAEAIDMDKRSKDLFALHHNFHIIEPTEDINEKITHIYKLIRHKLTTRKF